MTNKLLVREIYDRGNLVNIQDTNDPNPTNENLIFVDPKSITPQELERRLMEKFGLKNWTRLDFRGYVSTYCPEEIAEELRENKLTMIEYYSQFGLY